MHGTEYVTVHYERPVLIRHERDTVRVMRHEGHSNVEVMFDREPMRRGTIDVADKNVHLVSSMNSDHRPRIVRKLLDMVNAVIVSRQVTDQQEVTRRPYASCLVRCRGRISKSIQRWPIEPEEGSKDYRRYNADRNHLIQRPNLNCYP